ncbi:heavy metal translocating P-type ATPase [Salinisphaera sp. S4-8]
MCCAGCEAVARLIDEGGLGEFYRFRSDFAPTPAAELAGADDEWNAYDRDSVRDSYVRTLEGGASEAVLLLENITCAACSWLIERVLADDEAVIRIQVNPATGRAILRWHADITALSTLLRRIAHLGYRPHLLSADQAVPLFTRERRAALKRLIVAGLGMMQVMMYAVALYAGAIYDDMDADIALFLRGVSLLVATPVLLYSGTPFLRGAWRDLRARRPGMDVPVSLAIGGAYIASVYHFFTGGEIYFDSVTMFVFFLTTARFLEMSARHRAAIATGDTARALPATARRIATNGDTQTVPLAELRTGDRVRVPAGAIVPGDGRIVAGQSTFDESLLSGEFMPAAHGENEAAIAGSLNLTASVDIEIERIGQNTLVAGIVRLLERAQSERPRLALLADRIAGVFVSAVLVLACATGLYWWQVAPDLTLPIVLAVLVVTCPCALSLATPTAFVAGTASLARRGLLVARAGALQTLASADHLILDKTGTLTEARLRIERVDCLTPDYDADHCRRLAAALQAHSTHPIAQAFAPDFDDTLRASDIREQAGHGIEGDVAGRHLRLGQPAWLGLDEHSPEGATPVVLEVDGQAVARFLLQDTPRPQAEASLAALRELGFTLEIASGDSPGAVQSLAQRMGIDEWRARMTPEDKLARLRSLQSQGRRVVMVGDGINDAPVLGGADVSVAMGSGSVLAQSKADMLLTRAQLADLADGVRMARRTMRVIHQNLAWAACYNLVALPLAACGLVEPWMAALGMSASSLLVVANAARLARASSQAAGVGATPLPMQPTPAVST